MWATLHAREHNDLDGMTLIPAPKYGQTLLRSWARKHVSDHLVEEWRPNTLGYICLSEGLLQIACCMFSLGREGVGQFLRRRPFGAGGVGRQEIAEAARTELWAGRGAAGRAPDRGTS